MKCQVCGNDNPAGAQFCGKCGSSESVSKGGSIETASPEPLRTNCPKCGNDIEPNKTFCIHCGNKIRSTQNASGGSSGRIIAGFLIGLVFGFFYGLIPGFFIVILFDTLTIGILPGFAYSMDQSFGPTYVLIVTTFFGLVIFSIVGGIYGAMGWKPLKKILPVLIAVLAHSLLSYGIVVAIDDPPLTVPPPINAEERRAQQIVRERDEEESSTPYPTPVGLNYYEQGMEYLFGEVENEETYNKAIESFTKYIETNQNDARGYDRRGGSYQGLKRYQEAIMDYDKVIELNPESTDVYVQRGHCYRLLGQFQRAIKEYDKATELNLNYEWPYHYKGITYRELERYELAIQNRERYVELRFIESADWIESEQAAAAYTNIGLAYIELSQYEKAIEQFDKALKIDPNYLSANRGKKTAEEFK